MMSKIIYSVFSQYERKSLLENQTAFRQDYEPFENFQQQMYYAQSGCAYNKGVQIKK